MAMTVIKFKLLGLFLYWSFSVFEVFHENPSIFLIGALNITN
jgi:hypothetical protein